MEPLPQSTTSHVESTPDANSLAAFRALSLSEKALTIAQTQAMLFSNSVVQFLGAILRGNRPKTPSGESSTS